MLVSFSMPPDNRMQPAALRDREAPRLMRKS